MKNAKPNSILVFIGNDYLPKKTACEEIILWAKKLKTKTAAEINIALIGDHQYTFHAKNKYKTLTDITNIYTATTDFGYFDDVIFADAFYKIIKVANPTVALTLATDTGRAFFPRVAAKLNTGLTADCTKVSFTKDGLLQQTRPAYGGNIIADIICQDKLPQMATIRPGLIEGKLSFDKSHSANCIDIDKLSDIKKSFDFISSKIIDTSKSLNNAEIIIGVGKGLIKKANITIIEEFASQIHASIGATRACIDAGWFPHQQQIGLTGVTVRPKLYIACGISGTVQHMAGISGAKKIIAINKDKNAPIFNYADVAIVEDMFDFLPTLIKQIKIF